jgi:hypothetical protein
MSRTLGCKHCIRFARQNHSCTQHLIACVWGVCSVTVYSMAKSDVLTPVVTDALNEIGVIATHQKPGAGAASASAAANCKTNNENMPPPTHPNRLSTSSASSSAAAASSFVTPKKAAVNSYYQNKVDDAWDTRNDAQALVEYEDDTTPSSPTSGAYETRYSLHARKKREQQQKQQQQTKSSVFGFFSSVTSYFF